MDDDLFYELRLLDLAAIPDPGDKLSECEFFFALAEKEVDRNRFRWITSAFLAAAYSYFETSVMYAHFAFATEDGTAIADVDALRVLGQYVDATKPSGKNKDFIKTVPTHPLTKVLYGFRKQTTHHFSLSIMACGESLPTGFQFGNKRGRGTPALGFCSDVLALIRAAQRQLDAL